MVAEGRQRIDKWLFFSRALKSRSLAQKMVELGRVRINGEKAQAPSDNLKAGDTLTLTMDRHILVWRVIGLGERRGPATEAQELYENLSPPIVRDQTGLLDGIEPLRTAKRP